MLESNLLPHRLGLGGAHGPGGRCLAHGEYSEGTLRNRGGEIQIAQSSNQNHMIIHHETDVLHAFSVAQLVAIPAPAPPEHTTHASSTYGSVS
jgi:hypothetical protein